MPSYLNKGRSIKESDLLQHLLQYLLQNDVNKFDGSIERYQYQNSPVYIVDLVSDVDISLTSITTNIDSTTVDTGYLILPVNQTLGTNNWIHEVLQSSWRSYNVKEKVLAVVKRGSAYQNSIWELSTITLDNITPLTWEKVYPVLANDEKVKVSSDDTTSDWLWEKVKTNYTLARDVMNPAGNEYINLGMCDFDTLGTLNLSSLDCLIAQDTDGIKRKMLYSHFVTIINDNDIYSKVTATDTTSNFLDAKITTDYTLSKDVLNLTTNEQLQIKLCDFDTLTTGTLASVDNFIYQDTSGIKKKTDSYGFMALSQRAWTREGFYNTAGTTVDDTTAQFVDMATLAPTDTAFLKNKILTWGYDDNKARCLGKLKLIGSAGVTYTAEDLHKLHGEFLVIAADDYSTDVPALNAQCWFTVGQEASSFDDGIGIRNFMGSTEIPIDYCINAVFMLNFPNWETDVSVAKWFLMTYETIKQWFQRLTYTYYGATSYTYTIQLPATDSTHPFYLPFDGFYRISLDIATICTWTHVLANNVHWDSVTVSITDSEGTAVPEATDSDSITVGKKVGCPADCCCVLSNIHGINRLHWSGIINVTNNLCGGRNYTLTVTFPATADPTPYITTIAQSYSYLGKKKGDWCNDFA